MTRHPITYASVNHRPAGTEVLWLTSHGLARRRKRHSTLYYYRHCVVMLAMLVAMLTFVFWTGGSIRLP